MYETLNRRPLGRRFSVCTCTVNLKSSSSTLLKVKQSGNYHKGIPIFIVASSLKIHKSKTIPPCGGCFALFLLLVDSVFFGDRVEFFGFVFFARVFLYFIVVPRVINMPLTNTVFVAG